MGIKVEERFVAIEGITFHYVMAGSGPRVLLLHGSTVGWGQWYRTMAILAEKYQVIALDLPGVGRSSVIDFATVSSEQIVNYVASFITALEFGPCIVIGHSFGAWIALRLALKKAIISRLILISPLGFADSFPWQQKLLRYKLFVRFLTTVVFRSSIEHTRRFLEDPLENTAVSDQTFIRYVHEYWQERPGSHALWFMHELIRRGEPIQFSSTELKSVSVPCLVLSGEKDLLVDFKILPERLSHLQKGEWQLYSNAGHLLFWDDAKRFHNDIVNFLGGTL